MGDMSKCPHGGYVGYCDDCSPGWEMELIKADAADMLYMRGYNKGRTDQRELDAKICDDVQQQRVDGAKGEYCAGREMAAEVIRNKIRANKGD